MEPSRDDEDRFQILATSSLTLSGARVLKQGDTFAVFDRFGDIRSVGTKGAQGLYHDGTRFLSALRLRIGGERPLLLSSTVRDNNVLLAVDLMNPDLERTEPAVAHGTLHAFRSKFLWKNALYERIQLGNFADVPVHVELSVEFDADFVDVFEVRGTRRERSGTLHAPVSSDKDTVLAYTGLDGVERAVRLSFAPVPDVHGEHHAVFKIDLQAKQHKDFYVTASCEIGRERRAPALAFETAYSDAAAALVAPVPFANLTTDNEQFNDWINRATADLRMMVTDTSHGPYPYAGVPWFSAPFGRDGLFTALETLWVCPTLARGVLSFLSEVQALELDPEADAEPGKIVHEMRNGEMANLREIPFQRYYGSVDSTPLFVLLAAAYFDSTGDTSTLRRLYPNIQRALAWIDEYGDADGDGFVEYERHAHDGLAQQGWKDSHDSVFHSDGSAAEGPIALCEVQGYVYAAKRGAARIAAALGEADKARALEQQAHELRALFDRAFWCPDIGTYALALDGAKRPCRVMTSNAGHCLYTGIALPERAPLIAARLMDESGFSGWGVRTVAANERRYNPMSYHNGTIWPHDNGIVAAGLARYGHKREAARILAALFDASLFVDLARLPELFCGFPRRPGEGPTLYPVACAPQAWAAAVPFLLLASVLGLNIEASASRLSFEYPVLPPFLTELTLTGLPVAGASIDLRIERHADDVGIEVVKRDGRVSVVVVK